MVIFSLQWGRGRSTAEIRSVGHLAAARIAASMGPRSIDRGNNGNNSGGKHFLTLLQWGRGRSTAEMRSRIFPTRSSLHRLQWGRGRSTAEMGMMAKQSRRLTNASMGPRSIDRGNRRTQDSPRHHTSGFNGAAVDRPRKCRTPRGCACGGCDPFNPKLLCGICNGNTTNRAVSSG